MSNKDNTSKQPSGLTIKRDGLKFVCEWKIPSHKYDSQKFKSSPGGKKSVGKNTTKKTVEISASDYYPASGKPTLSKFSFSVKGDRGKGYKECEWKSKELDVLPPSVPTVSVAPASVDNKCTLTWSVSDVSDSNNKPYTRVEIQTKLQENCTTKPKDWTDWSGVVSSTSTATSGEVTKEEQSSVIATGSHTRLFRVRSIGMGGASAWACAGYTYAKPKVPENKGGSENAKANDAGGYDIPVEWDTAQGEDYPIGETEVKWTIATPTSAMECPSGASWNSGATISETSGKEKVHISTNVSVGLDQCLWTKLVAKHDSRETESAPVLRAVGKLSDPSIPTVENITPSSGDPAKGSAKVTAANANTVPDGTVLAVIFRKNSSEMIVGLIDANPGYATVYTPAWNNETDNVSFGVKSILPKSQSASTSGGVTTYNTDEYMSSNTVWMAATMAKPPVIKSPAKDGDNVRVSWENKWSDANGTELSWSDDKDAWTSTNKPETFNIDDPLAVSWYIAGLEKGKTWYIKARSMYDNGEAVSYSPYSATAEINLASAPNPPTIAVSAQAVRIGQKVTVSWDYDPTDGTEQAEGRVYLYSGGSYTLIATGKTQRYVDLDGWDTAGTRELCVEVVSQSGQISPKSSLMTVKVMPRLTCSITDPFTSVTITDDDGETRTEKSLTALPLSVTVSASGDTTMIGIERADSYKIERPDETSYDGSKGETIVLKEYDGNITIDDLIGSLDDGAPYILFAVTSDKLGQTARDEINFYVNWSHQALLPTAEAFASSSDLISTIVPHAPSGALSTDKCDIYRLSTDKPELIYKGASFDSKYIDPYPAFGESGGHRIVFRTANGDYITEDGVIAFYDTGEEDTLECQCIVIDFGSERVALEYDLGIQNSWKKDAKITRYLGGSIQGDWNPGVMREANLSAVIVPVEDAETLSAMRALSIYAGSCHVRTPDGSSYPADVQASEKWRNSRIVEFSLSVQRVDPEGLDGLPLDEWQNGG